MPSSKGSSWPRDRPLIPMIDPSSLSLLHLQAGSLPVVPPGKPQVSGYCCSVAQLCPALCDPMGCSTPGLPVHRHLLELAQTHIHWIGDAIQPSHPLCPPLLLPVFLRVFSNESALCIRPCACSPAEDPLAVMLSQLSTAAHSASVSLVLAEGLKRLVKVLPVVQRF